jgi:hypothetical protein
MSKKKVAKSAGFVSFNDVVSSQDINLKINDQLYSPNNNNNNNNNNYAVDTTSNSNGSTSANANSNLSPLYRGSDPELSIAAKKLIKRDGSTKIKAFSEVIAMLKLKQKEVLYDFLPYFGK